MRRWTGREPSRELRDVIRHVRRRWRLRLLLRGAAITLGIGFGIFLLSTFGIDRLRFADPAVTAFRVVLWVGVIGLISLFIIRPLFRRATDQQVALYLEEHEPTLESAVLSAVDEMGPDAGEAQGLRRRLFEVAVERARRVERGRRIDRDGLKRSSAWLGGVATAVLLIALFGPGFQGTAGSLLLSPWKTADAANPYAIDVQPGDILIPRGSDQEITAFTRGFETDQVEIAVRRGESETWERFRMVPSEAGDGFGILLFDLTESTAYSVESEGVRSPVYTIEVADLPYVDRIDLEYVFPRYTGLAPRTVEDAGDIAVLRGTEARLTITPTIPTHAGQIVLQGLGEPISLELFNGTLSGAFTVERETFYRVELAGPNGEFVVASPDYLIEPLDDQPPAISIREPGRDMRANPIEEVYVEVEAEDDYGLGRLELRFSVNGGEEQSVALHESGRGGVKELSRGHTFFLEELPLEPGDFVSYYATATDLASPGGRQTATSDIYFLEIRPFDRAFRQAEQGGGGGGGGGGGMDGQLSRQQRQIVAATFRLQRDGDPFDDEEKSENLATLTLLQGRLREQVEELVNQMQMRGVAADPTFRKVFEELPRAAEAMREAEERLGERRPDAALSPEQRALQHLQRAEAAFREVQVAMGRQGGGGGGGGGSPEAEDLADLFELELDRLRNQYESVQRGERRDRDQQVDEALQKLEELARRQQQLNERTSAQAGATDGGQGQDRLTEETEELARQLERLSREESRPDLGESARRLRDAADQMRRAAAGARRGGAQSQGSAALDRLRQARRLLENRRTAALEGDVEDALRRAERIVERQRELEEDVSRVADGGESEAIRRLGDRKDELASEVGRLEADLDRLARESRSEQRDASRALGEAANSARQNRLRDKILYSKGVIGARSGDYTRNFEDQITRDAEELRDRVADARDAFRESDPRRLGRQLDETRDLVRGLESLQERMRQRLEGAAEEGQGQQGQGREGRDQQGERQRGQGQEGRDQQGQGQEGQGEQGQGQAGQDQRGQGQRGQGRVEPQGEAGGGGFAPGGGRRLAPGDIRQFRNEFGQRREDAQRLREELRSDGVDVGDLAAAIRDLGRLESGRLYEDPEELQRLQEAILRGLKDFEFALRRGLSAELERLFLSGSDDVPAEYRALVEEYYRALSEGRTPPR